MRNKLNQKLKSKSLSYCLIPPRINAALHFIPATFGELPSYTNPTVFSRKGSSSVLSATWWLIYTPQPRGSSVFRRLQVHILAPALLPGAPRSRAAQHPPTFLGKQQSRAECSQEHINKCALIPDPLATPVLEHLFFLLPASNNTRQDWAAGRSRPGCTSTLHTSPSALPLLP